MSRARRMKPGQQRRHSAWCWLTGSVSLCLLLSAAPLRVRAQDEAAEAPPEEAATDAPANAAPPRELQIAADSVDMQLQQGNISFSGNVVVIDRGLRVESAALNVALNEAGQMTEAVFTGNVTIRQEKEDREAAAERAVYDMAQGELVLTGKPVLRAGDRTLRNAKTIIYNRITERIRTEGTRGGDRPTLTIPLAPAPGDAPKKPAE